MWNFAIKRLGAHGVCIPILTCLSHTSYPAHLIVISSSSSSSSSFCFFFFFFFNGSTARVVLGLFSSSPPDIPVPLQSPPSFYIPQEQGVPLHIVLPSHSWSSHRPSSMEFYIHYIFGCGPGSSVGIATEIGAGGSGIESRWGRDFPPVQTGPGAHSASCKTGTGSFPGVKCGRGVLLTTYPLLVPR